MQKKINPKEIIQKKYYKGDIIRDIYQKCITHNELIKETYIILYLIIFKMISFMLQYNEQM